MYFPGPLTFNFTEINSSNIFKYCVEIVNLKCFYPTALKGCRSIVFTLGVRMGRRAGGWQEEVCPGCISETIRFRKLILSRDIGWGV